MTVIFKILVNNKIPNISFVFVFLAPQNFVTKNPENPIITTSFIIIRYYNDQKTKFKKKV